MMTISEALPMLLKGKSLGEVQKAAEKRKGEERAMNVVSIAAFKANQMKKGIEKEQPAE